MVGSVPVSLKSNDHEIQVLRNLLKKYTQALKENIDSRFKDAMPVVSAFAIFNANAIPNRGTAEFLSYGSKEISTLSNHYFPGDKEAQQQVKPEWEKLKYDLLSWKAHIPQELDNITPTEWSLMRLLSMRTKYGHFYPPCAQNMATSTLSLCGLQKSFFLFLCQMHGPREGLVLLRG